MIEATLLFLMNMGWMEVVLFLLFWIWPFIDCLFGSFRTYILKIIWIVVILFIPIFGGILYFIVGRKQKIK
jgi:hypothetical protein